ncbi:hypothetical protein T492DRAFT_855044 [Pavlovales sp. CCMP2436]|nr:hypothetical protein T492DRAFT_855044 [Pavlovales sp. CCMP2436]
MNGYSHYMPYAEPGRSFDLVGYLVVAPSLVRAREIRLLAALRTTVDGLCLWGRNVRQIGKVQVIVASGVEVEPLLQKSMTVPRDGSETHAAVPVTRVKSGF